MSDPIMEQMLSDFEEKITRLSANGMLLPQNVMQVIGPFVARTHQSARIALAQKIRADYAVHLAAGMLAQPRFWESERDQDETPIDMALRFADELMEKCGIWADRQMAPPELRAVPDSELT